ncbi:MAG: 3D domain-containing protein [Aridibacter sp.]
MRNVARGCVFLLLVAFIAGVFYFQPKVEAVTILAKSQENIQQLNNNELKQNTFNKTINLDKSDTEDKKANNSDDDNLEEAEASSDKNARTFRATAYCLRGKTASGRSVRRGVVAADTRVLPLGTRIKITAGKYSGNYVVADTGGRIKGRVLDIWVPSCSEARSWGRRSVQVTVLGKRG